MGKNIVVVDSGAGGLTVLRQLKDIMPHEDFLYFADNANLPYGDKTTEALQEIASKIVTKISASCDVKLFVLACNTLTAAAIDFLRSTYPQYEFIGTEPNVKQATKENVGKTLVLVTPSCLKCPRLFFRLYCDDTIFLAMPTLAEKIENGVSDDEIEILIKKQLKTITAPFSSVVLGCTHYSLKMDLLKKIFDLPIYDSALGVAKRTKEVLEAKGLSEINELPVLSVLFSKTLLKKAFEYRELFANLKKNEKQV